MYFVYHSYLDYFLRVCFHGDNNIEGRRRRRFHRFPHIRGTWENAKTKSWEIPAFKSILSLYDLYTTLLLVVS